MLAGTVVASAWEVMSQFLPAHVQNEELGNSRYLQVET